MDKAGRRLHFKKLLNDQISVDQSESRRLQFEEKFTRFFRDFFLSRPSKSSFWGAFSPLPEEPPIFSALKKLQNIRWAFPKVEGDRLEFYQSEDWEKGPWGLQEPAGGLKMKLEKLDGFLIPGLAFTSLGDRLGRGRGFYDRSLAQNSALRVGVCFDFQITDSLEPLEDHDLKMDFIVTEQRLITCNERMR